MNDLGFRLAVAHVSHSWQAFGGMWRECRVNLHVVYRLRGLVLTVFLKELPVTATQPAGFNLVSTHTTIFL